MSVELGVAILIGGAAMVEDVWRRTVSNWLVLAALIAGIAIQSARSGWQGAGAAVLGAVAGFFVFLIFYLLGGMGGGDVKLMAGLGALVGIGRLLEAAFWTALLGAAMAVVVIGAARVRAWSKARGNGAKGVPEAPVAIPYAPAIALGAWLALISKP